MIMDGAESRNSFWGGAIRPISTFFSNSGRPGHRTAPSTESAQSAGLAGHGAYNPQQMQQPQQEYYQDYHQQEPEMTQVVPDVAPVAAVATTAASSVPKVLQPRQQYTFGQAYEPESSHLASGSAAHDQYTFGQAYEPEPNSSGEYNPFTEHSQQGYSYGDYPLTNPFEVHAQMPVSYPNAAAVNPERGVVRDEDVYGGM